MPPGASISVRSHAFTAQPYRAAPCGEAVERVRTLAVVPAVVDQLPLGPLATNCYVVRAERGATEALVVDPSGSAAEIRLTLASLGARCSAILVTHGHFDHILGLADLAEGTGAPVYAPAAERALLETPQGFTPPGIAIRPWTPDTLLEGGEALEVAGLHIDVLSVPGHSPGHLAYAVDGVLLSGDVLFAGSVGRTDFPGGDWDDAPRLDPVAHRAAPARDDGVPGARGRPRRFGQSLPRTRFSPSCASTRVRRPDDRPGADRAAARHP